MSSYKIVGALMVGLVLCAPLSATAVTNYAGPAQIVLGESVGENDFAIVNGDAVSAQSYFSRLREEARKRFYHGKIDQERLDELIADVSEQIIDRLLLSQEAEKRGIEAEKVAVDATLDEIDKQNEQHPEWLTARETVLPQMREQLETGERIRLLEESVRREVSYTHQELEQYYREYPQQFTQPAKNKASLILLKVEPSASSDTWRGTEAQMQDLRQRLVAGERFDDLAREYSEDESAQSGGDMGYQHQGTLHKDVEDILDALSVGEISEPVRLLIGYVLLRKDDYIPPALLSFKSSEQRTKELLLRKKENDAWADLINTLRQNAYIKINEQLLTLTVD